MFEIKAKDNMGRVGVLKTKHGDVRTPALMPVIHPRKQASQDQPVYHISHPCRH